MDAGIRLVRLVVRLLVDNRDCAQVPWAGPLQAFAPAVLRGVCRDIRAELPVGHRGVGRTHLALVAPETIRPAVLRSVFTLANEAVIGTTAGLVK